MSTLHNVDASTISYLGKRMEGLETAIITQVPVLVQEVYNANVLKFLEISQGEPGLITPEERKEMLLQLKSDLLHKEPAKVMQKGFFSSLFGD